MFVNIKNLKRELVVGAHNISNILNIEISSTGIIVTAEKSENGLQVEKSGNNCTIHYSKKCEFFRGLSILAEHQDEQSFVKSETAKFENLYFMADNSRNAVNNISTIKKLICHLAVCGYTSLMLYTEDTYKIKEYPYFGYMRGSFTINQIKELEEYGNDLGIELVPCIQTLAHLNAMFKWDSFGAVRDITDILLVGEEKTYELIDAMLKTLSEMYTSRTINIGMDEAFMLGKGTYADRNGIKPHSEIMATHLKRVVELCNKYGFKPMMWSDMFFRNSNSALKVVDGKIPESEIERIPQNVSLTHWDYVSENKEDLTEMLKKHQLTNRNVVFAGGAWKWSGYTPANVYSLFVSENAIKACVEAEIKDVIVTAWGDNGAESSLFSIIPVIQQFAEGNYSDDFKLETIKTRMKTCFNADLDAFLALDKPNLLPQGNESPGKYYKNPAKYILFQDVLCGLFDCHIVPEKFNTYFDACIEELETAMKKSREWKYVFDVIYYQTRLLRVKCDLGIRIRNAVLSKNSAELNQIAAVELPEAVSWSKKLHKAVKVQWFNENNAFGYEVQDIRLSGLTARLKSANARLSDYIEGRIERLEEVEEERLPFWSYCDLEKDIHVNPWTWQDIITANIL